MLTDCQKGFTDLSHCHWFSQQTLRKLLKSLVGFARSLAVHFVDYVDCAHNKRRLNCTVSGLLVILKLYQQKMCVRGPRMLNTYE